jgi:hypothetical protein
MQRLRKERPVSLGRHRRACTICAHPERFEIEQAFVTWASPAAIAQQYGVPRHNPSGAGEGAGSQICLS